MDDHDALQELLGAYALGALSDEETTVVEAHLEECDDCAIEAYALRAVVSQFGHRPAPPPTT